MFSSNDARDLISESDVIFTDNANFIEKENGVFVLGAKLSGIEDSLHPSFLGAIDQLRIIDGQYFAAVSDALKTFLCAEGQFYLNGVCNACHETCETCINELYNSCLSCFSGSYLYNSSCY